MNNFEYMREHLLVRAGIHKPVPAPLAHMSYDAIKKQECGDGFCDKMDNRIVMGFLRYGPMGRAQTPFYDYNKALNRLALYKEDGNIEHLIDAANFCRCEAKRSQHPQAHFNAQDR